MQVMRIGAITPPAEGRSKWAREWLMQALERQLTPAPAPIHQIDSFTVTLPAGMIEQIKRLSEERRDAISSVTAGLIIAAQRTDTGKPEQPQEASASANLAGAERVRPLLHDLLLESHKEADRGAIVFSEAATGTGKGRMIASLAAESAGAGDTVVVSAPLSVTWQLMDDLANIPQAMDAGVTVILGRVNFVAPNAVLAWAKDNDNTELIDWVENGGEALGDKAKKASAIIGQPLNWLLEDALSLAEDMPVSAMTLDGQQDTAAQTDCPAEATYQRLLGSPASSGIILCSHFMLASHIRHMMLNQSADDDTTNTRLPKFIDRLIVDEAHLVESAFAAINSATIHLRSFRNLAANAIPKAQRKALLDAIDGFTQYIESATHKTSTGSLDTEMAGAESYLGQLDTAMSAVPMKKLDNHDGNTFGFAHRAVKWALTGRSTLRLETTPVRRYCVMTVGQSNLEKPFSYLWDNVAGAILVSATLYSDGNSAKLARWKMAVPPDRAVYLPPVHPDWTFTPVTLHARRVPITPDDSDQWADECAAELLRIVSKAVGGTLVLCTSYYNAEQLSERLRGELGPRMIVQARNMSASACALQYKALHAAGIKPVWIGLGAAWTGIDLSDAGIPANQDTMLTDLVVTRLPFGSNRSLTHERRVAVAGYGIVVQEAAWHFRQGIGRLVRREGVTQRQLWVLDSRLDSKAPWLKAFNTILAQYRVAPDPV